MLIGMNKTPNTAANGAAREQDNKDLTLRMLERLNQGDVDGYVRFFAETVVNHGFSVPREIIRQIIQDIKNTFPDTRFEPLLVTAEGDWVTLRARFSGTHQGISQLPVNGGLLMGAAPTNRSFATDHIHLFHFRDGVVTEHYACRDDVEMGRQLGLLAPLPAFEFGATETAETAGTTHAS